MKTKSIILSVLAAATLFGGGVYFGRQSVRIENHQAEAENKEARVEEDVGESETQEVLESPTQTSEPKDRTPEVYFAATGRYLSPCGDRTIELKAVNMSSVNVETRRVEPRNIVQLLARDEDRYGSYYGSSADGYSTRELAGKAASHTLVCRNERNKEEVLSCPVVPSDGGSSNGVFLVSVGYRHRLVCISDLGLSVRTSGDGNCGVWVTSLSSGHPLEGVKVEIFSAANVKIMEGVTDSRGWVEPRRIAEGEFFAVIATTAAGDERSFIALGDRSHLRESGENENRDEYLSEHECEGYIWTDRGIYRHNEKVFAHALFREDTGMAPSPFPVAVELVSPLHRVVASVVKMTDEFGALKVEDFVIPEEEPSGEWSIVARIPQSMELSRVSIKVEEFAMPHIRVKVNPDEHSSTTNIAFEVAAEYLFGGACESLKAEGAVVLEDVPFEPENWRGYSFGNDELKLTPALVMLKNPDRLDKDGKAHFAMNLEQQNLGRPGAKIRVIAQGTVFEDGGRAVSMRSKSEIDGYEYYLGTTLKPWQTQRTISVVVVDSKGEAVKETKRLKAKIERIESVYSYRRTSHGWYTWNVDRIRKTIAEGLEIITTGTPVDFELPIEETGDYVLTIEDVDSRATYAKTFYRSFGGDSSIRAPLSNPTKVAVTTDKYAYRPGECPNLVIKAPFTGEALLSVMRDKVLYTEVISLTNATTELKLRPLSVSDAPNLEVSLSVVQSVVNGAGHFAARAHGEATIRVHRSEDELGVALRSEVSSNRVEVACSAEGGKIAVITLVDEGLNLLTDRQVIDPLEYFRRVRMGDNPIYDLYGMLLPVKGNSLHVNGIREGGDCGAELLSRVSPIPSRRFKPLSLWRAEVPVVDGVARAVFDVGEFAGEVRIAAVVYDQRAIGVAHEQLKIVPKVIMMADAPRFVAPGDHFDARVAVKDPSGSTNHVFRLKAPNEVGVWNLNFKVEGFGEVHEETIELPIRPAAAWRSSAGWTLESNYRSDPSAIRESTRVFDSPIGEYDAARQWLENYPYGCLEQTTSQIFPLLPTNSPIAKAGVKRVLSMMRENDFVMWPDCDYAPWTREVSIYAAHFLVMAERSGIAVDERAKNRLLRWVRRWTLDDDKEISAYAALVGVLAHRIEKDRLNRLYDDRGKLSSLSRARLALAFAETGDRRRANELLSQDYDPQSVKDAAFRVMALLKTNPDDERILPLIGYLTRQRDVLSSAWATTEENAHALMAVGAYFKVHEPIKGEKFIAWRRLYLPSVEDMKAESSGISISRSFFDSEGKVIDLDDLHAGQLINVELKISSPVAREFNDLVIEELLPGAFEIVHDIKMRDWVMRFDARDDRLLVFSKKFKTEAGNAVSFIYPVRVVSTGDFILPGTRVEGMYNPRLRAALAADRIVVRP